MKYFNRLTACALALWCFPLQANEVDIISPLAVRNLDAPMMRFFDPTPDSALRSYQQSWSFEWSHHYATVNLIDRVSKAQLLVDMELYVFDPVVRYAITPALELSLRTPILLPSSGIFDAAIQTFHGWFNMPNGGRELRPNNAYGYAMNHDKGANWQSQNRWELGNIELSGRYHLAGNDAWAMAGLAALKLPTASTSRGWSSGAADLAAGLVLSLHQGDWFAHVEGWMIQPLASDEPGISYKAYTRGSLTAGYQVGDTVAIIVQGQGGGSPYQSNIAELDHPPFLISFGLRGAASLGWSWSLAVVENISQKTTQDISMMAGLSWQVE